MASETSNNTGMSTCCLSGKVHQGTPRGREETVGGLQCYISEPENHSTAKSVIFISDIFGYTFPNLRLLADSYAQKGGFYVYVPDFHEGDSLPISFLQTVEPPLKDRYSMSATDRVKNTTITTTTLGPWLIKHRQAVAKPLIDGFVNTIRMTPGTDKIGVVGFCWGGRYAILQAHAREENQQDGGLEVGGGVDAAYACHPTLLGIPEDFEGVSRPLSLAVGGRDSLLDTESVGKIQDLLAKKTEVPHEIRIYEEQVHGFALRSDWSDEKDKKAMDDAEMQGIEWLKKFLS